MKKTAKTSHAAGAEYGGPRPQIKAWLLSHRIACLSSLRELIRAPLASLMTAAVIGIALALPAGLHVLLKQAQSLGEGLEDTAQISLFLKSGVTSEQATHLAERLQGRREIAAVRHISPEQALEEFSNYSGMGEALNTLGYNPLPAVLVIRPARFISTPQQAENLLYRLRDLPEVDIAQLDMAWVKRLHAMAELARRGVLILGGVLGLAVLLIVGNTIRLAIENRREEIEIIKLIGATDAFVRRPFLYRGLEYGLAGGVIACLLTALALGLLQDPVERLSALYNHRFSLGMLDVRTGLLVLGSGAWLGLLGAWLAVGRHLRDIQPG